MKPCSFLTSALAGIVIGIVGNAALAMTAGWHDMGSTWPAFAAAGFIGGIIGHGVRT